MTTLSCWVYPEGPDARTDLIAQCLRSVRPQLDGLQVRADALAVGASSPSARSDDKPPSPPSTLDSCGANYSSPGGRPVMVLPLP